MTTKSPISFGTERPATSRTFRHVENSSAVAGVPSHYAERKFHIVKRETPTGTLPKDPGGGPPLKRGPSPVGWGADGGECVTGKDISARDARADSGSASLAAAGGGLPDILEQLGRMSPQERKQVLDHLALQSLAAKTEQDRDIAMWSVSVQSGLVALLGGLDVSAYGVVAVRKLLGAAKTWRPVADLSVALGLNKLPVTERQAAYNVLASVLLNFASASAQRTGAALSLPYVVNCCQSIGAAFNAAFPGYIAGGCGPLLFNMMRKRLMAEQHAMA